jgi:drug/metabolite transporter (DMT)-like permease
MKIRSKLDSKKALFLFYSVVYLLGVACLTILLILMKKASQISGINIFQILFTRELIIVLSLLPLMIKDRFNPFKVHHFKLQSSRHILFSISAFFWYSGILLCPVNEMVALAFISQIMASLFAKFILKEDLKETIIPAIFVAFIGVLIMQAHKISLYNLTENSYPVRGYIFCGITILLRGYIPILNKRLAEVSSSKTTNYLTHIFFLVASAIFIPTFKFFSIKYLPIIFICSILYFIENYLLILANKFLPVHHIQLLDFSKIIFSILASALILNEGFTINQIIGSVLIFGSYILALKK